MAITIGRHDVMPELESLHHNFNFQDHILPSPSSSVYKAAVLEYVSMARVLRIYSSKPSTISTSCGIILEKRALNKQKQDGFTLLLTLLRGVFPHLGGKHLDVISEISSLTLCATDTMDSLLHKFVAMKRKLDISGHVVPTNALFLCWHYENKFYGIYNYISYC